MARADKLCTLSGATELLFIEKDSAVQFSAERSFMKSLCLNMQDRYSDLKDELKSVAILMKKDTTDIFNKLHHAGMIKKNKSVLMQAILPGLGMIKEGEVGEGLTSFLLNGMAIVPSHQGGESSIG